MKRRRTPPPLVVAALAFLAAIVAVFALADLIAPLDYRAQALRNRLAPPVFLGGDWRHLLGTDELGRDLFSRLIFAIRFSLLAALGGTVIGALIGTTLGFIAAHLRGAEVAAVDDAQRIHQLGLEHLRTAAIMRERDERADRLLLAHHDSEIGLQSPDRNEDGSGHAVLLLDPIKDRSILQQHALRLLDALGDPALGEFLEALLEDALIAVERQHLGIGRDAGERR